MADVVRSSFAHLLVSFYCGLLYLVFFISSIRDFFVGAINAVKMFLAILVALAFYLLLCLAYLVWEIIKLFPWAVMLIGIKPSKMPVLYALQRAHYRVFDAGDSGSLLLNEGVERLYKILDQVKRECKELDIAQWRQKIAYWLAVN
jgi:hypothetical protein